MASRLASLFGNLSPKQTLLPFAFRLHELARLTCVPDLRFLVALLTCSTTLVALLTCTTNDLGLDCISSWMPCPRTGPTRPWTSNPLRACCQPRSPSRNITTGGNRLNRPQRNRNPIPFARIVAARRPPLDRVARAADWMSFVRENACSATGPRCG